jgi:hypothetical protein
VDACSEFHLVEIDEEADRNIQEFHVAEELCLVDGKDLLRGFHFDENTTLNENVEAERLFAGEAFVLDLHALLADAVELAEFQFLQQAPLVDGLDKSRAFVTVDFDLAPPMMDSVRDEALGKRECMVVARKAF